MTILFSRPLNFSSSFSVGAAVSLGDSLAQARPLDFLPSLPEEIELINLRINEACRSGKSDSREAVLQ